MTPLRILTHHEAVDEYLVENKLESTPVIPLETVALQQGGTSSGLPCVLLVAEIDGQKRLFKTTLRNMLVAMGAFDSLTADNLGKGWRDSAT